MNNSGLYHTVAVAVRLEHLPNQDRVFVVFEITDEHFKHKIKKDWVQDIELEMVGKNLVTHDIKI